MIDLEDAARPSPTICLGLIGHVSLVCVSDVSDVSWTRRIGARVVGNGSFEEDW